VVRLRRPILLDRVIRQRLRYPDLKRVLVEQRRRYRPDIILMEEKGSGISILQELKSEKISVIGIKPIDNKYARASLASAVIESGRVLVPLEAPWLPEFKTEYRPSPAVDTTTRSIP
jgi:predicted phage terminase large subunit-like protein